jgi:MtrB/PioB family decaheme-associated outer membrane protein
MNLKLRHQFQPCMLAVAVLAAYTPAFAAEDDAVAQLAQPSSSISIGAGQVTQNNKRFGEYSGMDRQGVYGLADADIARRDESTGTWLKFYGRNLGLESRELRFEHERQGDWGYFIDYSRTPHDTPFTVMTGVTGLNTTSQVIPAKATTGGPVDLDTKRDAVTLGLEKYVLGNFNVQLRYKNEEKVGGRMFGQGDNFAAPKIYFLTEPINYTTRQVDATVGYTGQKLQMVGGYYGTLFNNHNSALAVSGGTGLQPIALPPDNQSHQINLTGGYNFTSATRSTFRLAYTRQTQTDSFFGPAPNVHTDLGAVVYGTQAQLGLTSQPLPKLSLLANVRYNDRRDQTPVAIYTTAVTATSTLDGTNEPRSHRNINGKVEASYQLPMGFRFTGGVEEDHIKRNLIAVRVVSFREETRETSYRAELRRAISDNVTGALSFVHSNRGGSPFLTTLLNGGGLSSNQIAPLHLADRTRDKARASVSWAPMESLSVQFVYEDARDSYPDPRTNLGLGARSGTAHNFAVDAAYSISEAWQASAWISHNDTAASQATCVNVSAAGVCPASATQVVWGANLHNLSDSFGLGLRGKPTVKIDVNADLSYSSLTDQSQTFGISGPIPLALSAAQASGGSQSQPAPPDTMTRVMRLKLLGTYAIDKTSSVRVDYVYDRFRTTDWTWTNWVYTDGTTVLQNSSQKAQFIGVSYIFKFK